VSRRSALRGLSVVATHTDDINRLKNLRRPVLIVTGSDTVSFHRRINDIFASAISRAERVVVLKASIVPRRVLLLQGCRQADEKSHEKDGKRPKDNDQEAVKRTAVETKGCAFSPE
jgi:hypothetical protein